MPMQNTLPLDDCRSVFKSGKLSTDAYTNAWISLINEIEKRKKDAHIDSYVTNNIKSHDIINNEMACPAEGGRDDV